MGRFSISLGSLADEIVTECEFATNLLHVLLPSGDAITYQEVYEADLHDYDAIIGMDIITRGNFHLDSNQGETLFSFQLPNS